MPARLTIELVPRTCWFSNVRSEVSSADWETLKKLTSKAANYHCEVCGGRGPKWPVECHEVWEYLEPQHVQRLIRLVALCPACHEVKHIGLAQIHGRLDEALRHLAKVNSWSTSATRAYAEAAMETWDRRSQFEWTLDLSYLDQLHIAYQ
jgi:hypothetical protein